MDADIVEELPWPRQQRPSAELERAVRAGRRISETLHALDSRAADPDADDLRLAEAFARFLVRRCEDRHQGWRTLRAALLEAGADVPWERCERQAIAPAAERLLEECAAPGRTPLVRVQHAAAQERARAIAPHVDPALTLKRLEVPAAGGVDAGGERWAGALVAAVTARSRERVVKLLAEALG